MEMIEEQYARIKDSLPVQRGNVSLSNLRFLNSVLYVARISTENGREHHTRTYAARY